MLHHWEHTLYQRIKGSYNDILRAMNKRIPDDSEASDTEGEMSDGAKELLEARRRRTADRVRKLKEKPLPKSERNVDDVVAWMDRKGWQRRVSHIAWKHSR